MTTTDDGELSKAQAQWEGQRVTAGNLSGVWTVMPEGIHRASTDDGSRGRLMARIESGEIVDNRVSQAASLLAAEGNRHGGDTAEYRRLRAELDVIKRRVVEEPVPPYRWTTVPIEALRLID
jgi:hypothetical protein